MKPQRHILFITILELLATAVRGLSQDEPATPLPPGVRGVWDLDLAYREATPTRERVCLNGLWRWQPARDATEKPPASGWGYFKVPGCWPGIADYMQKDCQTVHAHPSWKNERLGGITAAWYEREMTVPAEWSGRRITVSTACLNSFAAVLVDGHKAGEIRFPGGEVDISAACRPGARQVLSLLVVAMPLKGVMMSYGDTFGARQVKGTVERRGLCGDVYLAGTPANARLGEARVSTSVRKWEITFEAGLEGLAADMSYALRARIRDQGRRVAEFTSKVFQRASLREGRIAFTERWKPEKLWDTHTPRNMYQLDLALVDGSGQVLDAALPERFGFREFWIDGRDFYLNGSRIFLCAVPFDNAQIGAAWATYEGAKESLERLKGFGINFVYTHNYGCEPGTHLSFAEILRAADDEGMLVSFSQPHFGQYQWRGPDADQTNGYARHAASYVRAAQNHPSVVFYSMSHNATGTEEEMNPDMIDGILDIRNRWSANNVQQALRAEAIVTRLDPSRIVYHHSSGNLGSMHTANFYANFAPIQEMSDWLEHWATKGIKPVFFCEYGVPIFWDWMMYRGWYKGTRTFGSAQVPWEFCLAEWDAQFVGDQAFKLTELENDCLRWEAKRFRAGQLWHRWDYPRNAIESSDFEQRNAVMAMYLTDNLRAFRTWGISAFCPWDHGTFWKLREGVKRARKELQVDWKKLQRPGFSPDYVDSQMEWINTSYERSDWVPTVVAQALIRNNLPLLAYLGGKPAAFTSKDHNFQPGDTVEKQVIVINNSRAMVQCSCSWSLALPEPVTGRQEASVETGQQARLPLKLALPEQTKPGRYELRAVVKFSTGETQEDTFAVDVLPRPGALPAGARMALFDPKGETGRLLRTLGSQTTSVEANTDLSGYDILIVGKAALTPGNAAPDITRVRDGLKVVIFEQTAEALEQRFGFRVAEYGLRWVFKRVPDHPLLAGIGDANLWNWRGEATLLPPRLNYVIGPRHAPEVKWCGLPVTRLWRAGNRGNVASVLIEKPARGDFMPVLDGGFSLQFSPLLEDREGRGLILFCQMDVTGRTESDPAAGKLVRNILEYVTSWKPAPSHTVLYVGDPAGKQHLERAGFAVGAYQGGRLSTNDVLVVGEGGGKTLAGQAAAVAEFLRWGGRLLAAGLDAEEANTFLPFKVETRKAEHVAAYFEPFGLESLLAGVSPAEVHNRDPRSLPLVKGGATVIGDGVLATAQQASVVFCQFTPYGVLSAAGATGSTGEAGGQVGQNVRKTYRRTSFLMTRLLANLGAAGSTPVLERFHRPVDKAGLEARWRDGLYLDVPEEWDDPYRFFCW
jgi:beta-galactosidase